MAENTEGRLEREEQGTVVITGTKGAETLKKTIELSSINTGNDNFYQPLDYKSYNDFVKEYFTVKYNDPIQPGRKIVKAEVPKYDHKISSGYIVTGSDLTGSPVILEEAGYIPPPPSFSESAEGIPMRTATSVLNDDGSITLKMNDIPPQKHLSSEEIDELLKSVDYSSTRKGFRNWLTKPEHGLIQNIGVGHTITSNDVQGMSNGNPRRVPIICRHYDNFIATIQDLYGPAPETPTMIPVAILFQFELSEDHYNIDYKPEERMRDDYNEEYYGHNHLVKERRKSGYHEIPNSGYACITWLIKNNYIPAYYSIHTDEDEIHELMAETLHIWMNDNNYRDN